MNAIFTGRRRSGKTTLAFFMALEADGGIIVYDPKNEFLGWPNTVSSVEELDAASKRKDSLIVVYHPNGDTEKEFVPVGEWILRQHSIAMQQHWIERGLCFTLLIDEAHNLQGPNWTNSELLQILSQNRPEILNVYQTFQSPKDAFNRIKSRVSDWYIFSTNLPSDIEYLEREIGVSSDDLSRIQFMGDYEYAHFHFDGGTPVAEFGILPEALAPELIYTKEGEAIMAERESDNREENFPAEGLTIHDHYGLNEAFVKYNRRKKDDPKSKYRQRAGDNVREGSGGNSDRGGNRTKPIEFGKKKSA